MPAIRFPQLIAFDLDYTLWDLWIDTHVVTAPLRRGKKLNSVVDRYGYNFGFYPEVPELLHELSRANVHIAACSRTHAPALARQALDLLLVPPPNDSNEPPKQAISFFNSLEIYPGSKLKHLQQLHQKTGIPYAEMVFFDDESRNKEVESLGVTFVLAPEGVARKLFEAGIEKWRHRMGGHT